MRQVSWCRSDRENAGSDTRGTKGTRGSKHHRLRRISRCRRAGGGVWNVFLQVLRSCRVQQRGSHGRDERRRKEEMFVVGIERGKVCV